MLVADLATMFARIGVMRALNRHHVRSSIRREKNRIGGGESSKGTNDSLDLRRHQQAGWRPRSPEGFASEVVADTWLEENDPEGVAFEYDVLE